MPSKRAPAAAPAAAPAKPRAAKPAGAKRAPKVKAPAPPAAAAAPAPAPAPAGGASAVHITSSKACQAFATRAAGLAAAIAAARPGTAVTIDAQAPLGRKPDRGSFAVRVGASTVVECLNMPRPFSAMKALDMDDVAKRTIALL